MTSAPPLTASIHDSSRVGGQVTSRWPDPMSVRAALLRGSCPHRTPGLTSGTHEKAHPQKKCQTVVSTFGPDVGIAHLGIAPSGSSQLRFWGPTEATSASPLGSSATWNHSVLCSKHQNPAHGGHSPGCFRQGFTPAKSPVHLAALHDSAVPSHKAGIRASLPAWH